MFVNEKLRRYIQELVESVANSQYFPMKFYIGGDYYDTKRRKQAILLQHTQPNT